MVFNFELSSQSEAGNGEGHTKSTFHDEDKPSELLGKMKNPRIATSFEMKKAFLTCLVIML